MKSEFDSEQFEEINPEFYQEDHSTSEFDDLDEPDILSPEFVARLTDKIMKFMVVLVGHDLHVYQKPLAHRIIESVLINDGEEITALASRQSGKQKRCRIL